MISNGFLEERRDRIVQLITERGRMSTKDLSDILGTSIVTIRNDINELDAMGLIVKTHGGALSFSKIKNYEPSALIKSQSMKNAKELIGKYASSLVLPGDVIILDAGTTTFEVAKNICQIADITVVTNDIQIAYYLATNSNAGIIVPGGTKAKGVYTLTGTSTLDFMGKVHADKLFLGCDAIDFKCGVTNHALGEADIKRAMIDASDEVIAVVDSSKVGKKVFAKVCSVDEVDLLVIDSLGEKEKKTAESINLRYVIAGE